MIAVILAVHSLTLAFTAMASSSEAAGAPVTIGLACLVAIWARMFQAHQHTIGVLEDLNEIKRSMKTTPETD